MTTTGLLPSDLPLHEHLRAHARATPDKAAYLWYGARITFTELDQASDAFAAHLHQLGVRKGDPVALFMNNCPQYVMAHYGIQKLGAIVCHRRESARAHWPAACVCCALRRSSAVHADHRSAG